MNLMMNEHAAEPGGIHPTPELGGIVPTVFIPHRRQTRAVYSPMSASVMLAVAVSSAPGAVAAPYGWCVRSPAMMRCLGHYFALQCAGGAAQCCTYFALQQESRRPRDIVRHVPRCLKCLPAQSWRGGNLLLFGVVLARSAACSASWRLIINARAWLVPLHFAFLLIRSSMIVSAIFA